VAVSVFFPAGILLSSLIILLLLTGCLVDGSQAAENMVNVVTIEKMVMALCIDELFNFFLLHKGRIAHTPYYVRYMTIDRF
jgi:hypothetical protein